MYTPPAGPSPTAVRSYALALAGCPLACVSPASLACAAHLTTTLTHACKSGKYPSATTRVTTQEGRSLGASLTQHTSRAPVLPKPKHTNTQRPPVLPCSGPTVPTRRTLRKMSFVQASSLIVCGLPRLASPTPVYAILYGADSARPLRRSPRRPSTTGRTS